MLLWPVPHRVPIASGGSISFPMNAAIACLYSFATAAAAAFPSSLLTYATTDAGSASLNRGSSINDCSNIVKSPLVHRKVGCTAMCALAAARITSCTLAGGVALSGLPGQCQIPCAITSACASIAARQLSSAFACTTKTSPCRFASSRSAANVSGFGVGQCAAPPNPGSMKVFKQIAPADCARATARTGE